MILTRVASKLFTPVINYALCSSARAANEFEKAKIEFFIINKNSLNLGGAIREHNATRARVDGTRLLLQISNRQSHKLKFLNQEMRFRFDNGDVVHVPVGNGEVFDDVAYVSDWSQRFSQTKVGILLPQRITAFFGGPISNEQFRLSAPVERMLAPMQLDSELFNVMCDVRNSEQARIVFCLTRYNVIPPFARLFSVISSHIIE